MIRIQTVYTGLPGLPGVTSYYFQGNSPGIAQDAADAVTLLNSALALFVSNDVTMDVDNLAVQINPETGDQTAFYAVTGGTWVGTRTEEVLPLATQLGVNFGTNGVVASRRVAGRCFVPGFTEGDSTDGSPGVAVAPNIEDNFATTIGNAPLVHVVWSRPVDGGRPGSEHPVQTYTTQGEWAVLRSRRPK